MKRILESVRDWGRDCWCDPGKDNTCGKRFEHKLGELPAGYDHKYTYSNLGYNLKITDMQAAVGVAQLDRLDGFIASRRENFEYLKDALKPLEEFFVFPEATPHSNPSWFGFVLTVRSNAPFSRDDLIRHLDSKKIATRLLFGGNLIHQPYMLRQNYRVSGSLKSADIVTSSTFWLGVYPGLTRQHLEYMIETIQSFCGRFKNRHSN